MTSMASLPKLPRRALGSTGLELSVLGFGASPLGGVFGDVEDDVAKKAVHDAFNYGINFFDTSPFYGLTKSETLLGKCLQGLPRSEFFVSTKAVRSTLLLRMPTYSLNDSTLETLIPYLEEKGVGIVSASPLCMGLLTEQGPPSWHPAPSELQPRGYDSQHSAEQPPMVTCVRTRRAHQLKVNLRSRNLSASRFSTVSVHGTTDDACRVAAACAKDKGSDISKIALAHAVRMPNICSTLVGMAHPDMVRSNVNTTLQALGLIPLEGGEAQAKIDAAVLKEVDGLLASVSGLSWASGKTQPGNA
eukprot:gene6118-2722_t